MICFLLPCRSLRWLPPLGVMQFLPRFATRPSMRAFMSNQLKFQTFVSKSDNQYIYICISQ